MSPLKGNISIGNTSEPTIDFQGTFVSFRGSVYDPSLGFVFLGGEWQKTPELLVLDSKKPKLRRGGDGASDC